ncbi:MAG: quinone-dependent dihydroorotate dehydrogenase [Opitutales bacterium]|nr:quinone-dependent dihydroorotate dehydrogenase [Opitutales bacterium]
MGILYEKVMRPILFTQDPEKIHERAVVALDLLGRSRLSCAVLERFTRVPHTRPVKLFGLEFPNMVGMAAGLDKNAQFWRAASALGFGHVEIGTVTNLKQPGNPKPRLFRYPKEKAIINRMGFNNLGSETIARNLKRAGAGHKNRIPLGINIGKSKVVPLDKAVDDYLGSFNHLADFADYITINVSSPNTPELRKLQGRDYLDSLLGALRDANVHRSKKLGTAKVPMLLKIAPDLTFSEIDSIVQSIYDHEFDGIIATNTTIERPGAFASIDQTGGLSGLPLQKRSRTVVNYIYKATDGKLPIVGVGGLMDERSVGEMVDAGASLVQVYTGFIYGGPFFASRMANALASHHCTNF